MGLSHKLFQLAFGSRMEAYDGIPGPEPKFPFGNALDFWRRFPWEVCAEYGEEYGDVVLLWLGRTPVVLLHDADLIGEVLEERRLDFYKDNPVGALTPVLTLSSPNINNGAEWELKRGMSAFSQPWIREWFEAQVRQTGSYLSTRFRMLEESTASSDFEVYDVLHRLTFDAFAVGVVGQEIGEGMYRDFMTLATMGSRRMLSGLPFRKDLNAQGREARKRWQMGFRELIALARFEEDKGRNDLLALAMRHGTQLNDADLAAELGNVFFGGAFSVPSSLTTFFWCLSEHLEVEERLRQELPGGVEPTLAAIEGCDYLDWALKESMRYRTAVPLFGRRVQKSKPTELMGRTLPENTTLFISSWRLHRSEKRWEDGDLFDPNRWSGGVAAENPLGSAYFFPLGRGPRMCMGADYAMFYMKLVIATLLRRHRLACGAGQKYDDGQTYYFGVRLPRGLRGKLGPRNVG